jgi:pimeloyl-ACP methyl ester carboxylesterase
MVGWANTDPNNQEYLSKAKHLVANGEGEILVSAECWLDKTPISAQTYATICEKGSSADIYGERDGGPILGKVRSPMLIIYGTDDIGITKIDGTIVNWLSRVNAIKNGNTEISTIEGASHGFKDFEDSVSIIAKEFVKK